jgi:GNAT superfamily N-acetyltransferase
VLHECAHVICELSRGMDDWDSSHGPGFRSVFQDLLNEHGASSAKIARRTAAADTLLLTDGVNSLEYAAADGEPLILAAIEGEPDALLAELRASHPEAVIVPGTADVATSPWWQSAQHQASYTAGAKGDTPDLTFTIEDGTWAGQFSGKRALKAFVDGTMVGHLIWMTRPERHWSVGEVVSIEVEPEYRRRGIATAMLARARQDDPTVHHGPVQTEDGAAWSQKAAGLASQGFLEYSEGMSESTVHTVRKDTTDRVTGEKRRGLVHQVHPRFDGQTWCGRKVRFAVHKSEDDPANVTCKVCVKAVANDAPVSYKRR